ncbi:MAG: DUF488 domain-containing protein [Actinomycetia bacterium]|nr:DUF488 domain-containing protein [Actinomycetes bacterium]
MTVVCTIGYEGLTAEEWIELLKTNEIDVVVDVRDVPQSRKRGFSKSKLKEALDTAGISYVHYGELGNPRKWRQDLNAGLDFRSFAKRFDGLMDQKADTLEDLYEGIQGKRACLICYEEDPAACHRSLVANRLRKAHPEDVEVEHLRHN